MSPIPEPQSRTAFRDRSDRVQVTSVIAAAALIVAGHPLLQVIPHRTPLYIFDPTAQPAVDRLKRSVDEALANLERARQAQARRTGARS